jgi:hypothetical protein
MSKENVEIMRGLNAAFNLGDTAGAAELLAPDLVYVERGEALEAAGLSE